MRGGGTERSAIRVYRQVSPNLEGDSLIHRIRRKVGGNGIRRWNSRRSKREMWDLLKGQLKVPKGPLGGGTLGTRPYPKWELETGNINGIILKLGLSRLYRFNNHWIIPGVRIKKRSLQKIKEELHCSCSGSSNQPDKTASQSSTVVFSIEKPFKHYISSNLSSRL